MIKINNFLSFYFFTVFTLSFLFFAPLEIQSLNDNENKTLRNRSSTGFSPLVTAICSGGIMNIKVETTENFSGIIQSRDYKRPHCTGYGEKSKITYLRINMLAESDEETYCGIFFSDVYSEERSVAIAVRLHRSLELASDKFYMVTCGKSGFQNTRNETSSISLLVTQNGKKVSTVTYGSKVTLKAHFSLPDGKHGIKVKRCFSFSDTNNTVNLVDNNGCTDSTILSEFRYNHLEGSAEADLYSMFKFPQSNRVHFQCDILICKEIIDCETHSCKSTIKGREETNFSYITNNLLLPSKTDGSLMASYSLFLVEPGSSNDESAICSPCERNSSSSSVWIYTVLSIVFGLLFLFMLIVNLFLCGAMVCSCTSSETEEKEKARNIMEDFDPYNGSHTGSRYPLHHSLSNTLYSGSKPPSLRYSYDSGIKRLPSQYSMFRSEFSNDGVTSNPQRSRILRTRGTNSSSSNSTQYSGTSLGSLVKK